MKKVNGTYKLSATDVKRIKAHTRAIARSAAYDGEVEAVFNSTTGRVEYHELVGTSYLELGDAYESIYTARTPIRV